MKINWYGHAAFRITTAKGTKIIIDPYEAGSFNGALAYGKINDEADIVITSHDHADHNYIKDIPGEYIHIDREGSREIKDVKIKDIPVFHDNAGGKERGRNLISVIAADNLVVAHLGDIGHNLERDDLQKMGKVDVLLLPVGGFFTIDAATAVVIMNEIKPSITIPMHYKTSKCAFPIAPVADFTKGQKNVRMLKESEIEITRETLPREPEIIVLRHSL
jgi:L-ascorbate metabolism protein UlaG (beta-lactamase superfamily)